MHHLPSFSRLSLDALRQADTGTKKRERDAESAVTFKASSNGDFRKLSNLFGPVEWLYQQTKFHSESAVFKYLAWGLTLELAGLWSGAPGGNFDAERIALGHGGLLKSYVAPDGQPASGLLAQHTSLIAKNPKNPEARKRLTHIRRRVGDWDEERTMTQEEMDEWHADNVNDIAPVEQTRALMLQFLREKFSNPAYAHLLRSTGTRDLHERPGRGRPSLWEFVELTDAQRAKGYESGGDLLGILMTQVRAELPTEAEEEAMLRAKAQRREGRV